MGVERELDEERIRAVVRDELEQQTDGSNGDARTTRRRVLGGASLLGAGVLGAGIEAGVGGGRAPSAGSGNDSHGAADEPLDERLHGDVVATDALRARTEGAISADDSLDFGGSAGVRNASSVSTDDLDVDRQDVQAALDGYLVPVGEGVGLDAGQAIDPGATATPLQDATDVVVDAGSGYGAVLLPPTSFSEGAPYRPKRGVSVIGWGRDATVVDFTGTGTSAHGFHMDTDTAGSFAEFRGFRISGPGPRSTTGNGWLIEGDVANVTVDQVGINGWADTPFYAKSGLATAWNVGELRFNVNDPAAASGPPAPHIELNSAGPAWTFDNVYVAGTDTSQSATDADVLSVSTATDVSIDTLNVGGAIRRAVDAPMAEGEIDVDTINFEPAGKNSTSAGVVRVIGDAAFRVGAIRLNGPDVDHDYVYRVTGGASNKRFGPVNGDAEPNANVVEVTATGVQAWYWGPTDDVSNNAGGALDPGVDCLRGFRTVT